jgi:hypothetical protein
MSNFLRDGIEKFILEKLTTKVCILYVHVSPLFLKTELTDKKEYRHRHTLPVSAYYHPNPIHNPPAPILISAAEKDGEYKDLKLKFTQE